MNQTNFTELSAHELREISGGIDIEINWEWIKEQAVKFAELVKEAGEALT